MDARFAEQFPGGQHMGLGKITDMNVVSNRSSVARVEIGSVDGEYPVWPQRCLDHQGDDMRLRFVPLTDLTVGVAAGGIEIAQHDRIKPMRPRKILDHSLDHELRPPIGVDRRLRMPFVDRRTHWNPIRRASAGEDQLADASPLHLL
jgi:hypothetical protein